MCGITGYFGQGNQGILKKMTDSLKHRGPDDQGFYIKDNLGLGHRRLSIIDLDTGRQPMANENKSVWLIFNGEIYNFKELKEKLIKKNHQFRSQSDTETIIHLYEEKGEDFLKELNGMFALALWDELKQKLILARDRLGQKPLYYSLNNQTLVFGSEIKALLKHPAIKRELDLNSLTKYLIYEYIPVPHSIFKNIYKLGPGEYLIYQNNDLEIKKYWNIKFDSRLPISSFQDCLQEFEEIFEEAVRMRLISDVPLGIFLSGGIDSTAIAYYAQKNSTEKIKTFSIGFTDQSFDESKYARQAAKFLGSEHYEKILEPKDCLDLIPQISEFLDEPLADASIVPTFLLAKFTRQEVTVALSGDGGDELLMGYPMIQAHKLARIYQKIPKVFREKIITPSVNRLPVSFNNISFDFKLKKFVSGFEYQPEIRDQIWLGSFSPKQLKQLFPSQIYQEIKSNNHFEEIKNYLKLVKEEPLENRLIYLYLKNYLQDDILVKTDRASMAVGLEARAPFLDYQLVDFINSLPVDYKFRGWQTKYIFKKMMEDKIPKNIVYRPKKGFGMPIAKWMNKELRNFTLGLFEEARIKNQGIFDYSYVKQLLEEHFSGKKDNRKLLWTLMVFQMWHEKWR